VKGKRLKVEMQKSKCKMENFRSKLKDEFGWPQEVKNIFPFLFAILAFDL